ncbi:MAG: hypothetical protein Q4Q23_00380 [Methanobacteriaceae archaeon]|nr:hypothetical protein [Methanobacteriaceae archaeon]
MQDITDEKNIEWEEEDPEDYISINADHALLKSVQILFKSESEVEVFYNGLLKSINHNKKLKKDPDNREETNKVLLNELLKYFKIDKINTVVRAVKENKKIEKVVTKEEKETEKILKKVFPDNNEFKKFITLSTRYMMENKEEPLQATVKSMINLGKTKSQILEITSILDKLF